MKNKCCNRPTKKHNFYGFLIFQNFLLSSRSMDFFYIFILKFVYNILMQNKQNIWPLFQKYVQCKLFLEKPWPNIKEYIVFFNKYWTIMLLFIMYQMFQVQYVFILFFCTQPWHIVQNHSLALSLSHYYCMHSRKGAIMIVW
jgi:hypothetical protein